MYLLIVLSTTFGTFALLTAAERFYVARSLDGRLRAVIMAQQIEPLRRPPAYPDEQVALGQALFFDNVLSGNRNVSCATCHHPAANTTDGLVLSIGTREDFERTPRNALALYNVFMLDVMFWDGRLARLPDGSLQEIQFGVLPPQLVDIAAAQAMFPVTSRTEMRGNIGDVDVFGHPNELAGVMDVDRDEIWAGLMTRLLAYPEYRAMFVAAYPDVETFTFVHAANALAAFQAEAFTFTDSPWNGYVAGERRALDAAEKRGALVFFGAAGCAACHSGTLLSDQQFHNIAVPQVGPGKGYSTPSDVGHALVTGRQQDFYTFRTPTLHNVTLTAPYMHNGVYSTLADVLQHKQDPAAALRVYMGDHLPPDVPLHANDNLHTSILGTLSPLAQTPPLSEQDENDLIAFLGALTDPAAADLAHTIPDTVPSGLPVHREPAAHVD